MISEISGNIVDILNRNIYPGKISFDNGRILEIKKIKSKPEEYIMPGFIDSHIHIESSMLTPQHFSRIAVSHGTIGVVSDPHEIANVLGLKGIMYMINNAMKARIKFYFGAPSCVPATIFESSGASIDLEEIDYLFKEVNLKFLSEMMNYPGVISKDKSVIGKLQIAKKYNKRIDGHAPGLRGENLDIYIKEGIETDHECFDYDEAVEKIQKGMIIQIREGSAAKNFTSLEKLIDLYPENLFFCTDDLHPDDLLKGHINKLVIKGVERKHDLFNLLRIASYNPVKHYGLEVGMLLEGDPADFILVQDLKDFVVKRTYINGELVYQKGRPLEKVKPQDKQNRFNVQIIYPRQLKVKDKEKRIKVINARDGDLITTCSYVRLKGKDGYLYSDVDPDILKLLVLNRYKKEKPALGFIKNFGLKYGAIASSISHDNHNIIALGVDDESICRCVNWLIRKKGGIALSNGNEVKGIPLPIAGIMSDKPAEWIAFKYEELNSLAREMGCQLSAPFMTLSFMSLIVIPALKLSSKGLFDVNDFKFTSLYTNRNDNDG